MCKAMEELRAEAEMIGEVRGEARGEARGIRIGRKDERIRSAKAAARTLREAGISEDIIHTTVARILKKAA